MDRKTGIFKFEINKKDYKKIAILFLAVIAGVMLMITGNSKETGKDIYDERVYVEELENKLENVLKSIEGVGECSVAVTLKNGGEAIYSSAVYSSSPILIKTNQPEIRGVAVVIEGADDVDIQNHVISAVKSLTDVSSSRISVSKKIS